MIQKVSVVLATHNEELNLEQCLAAVKDFADEVIVVDGESTDTTVALAKKLGARVISTTNKANFHINKQMAMDEAKNDLVLQLDADEVIDQELIQFIQELRDTDSVTARQHASEVAWWIRRRNYFLGTFLKKGGQYPDPSIRLYRRGKARLPQKDVHELMVADGPVGWAEGHMLHYPTPHFSDYMRKFQTYTSFKAQQLFEKQEKISLTTGVNYLLIKPTVTFMSLFVRHKGFVDGIPGFVFALMSGLHHTISYLKLWELHQRQRQP